MTDEIVVDSSALLAVVNGERKAQACRNVMESQRILVISAATLTETLIVSRRQGVADEIERIIAGLGFVIIPLSEWLARKAADAHDRFGRGQHPARLNYGDCFAYSLAKERKAPLLFVGDDFSKADIESAL